MKVSPAATAGVCCLSVRHSHSARRNKTRRVEPQLVLAMLVSLEQLGCTADRSPPAVLHSTMGGGEGSTWVLEQT